MNKKNVRISHWKTQLDTTKDTLIRINLQKTKQTKNIRGGGYKGTSLGVGIGEIKDTIRRIWKECTERKAEDGQSI